RRFIMVDSPYRWITLGIWRGEIAVRVLVCSYLITGTDVCARLSRRRAIDHREDVSEPDKRDELAALHSITLSASASKLGGTSRPCCGPALRDRPRPSSFHSITSSARPSRVIGKLMPSALAVLRFRTSSTFVDCCTGSSPAFSPLRIRPT